ncbi:MAG: nucleotidyltransferase [Actinomycetota bacterium]|nr:nucleotidyltransferase [Actinomycetota bacterium]MDQ5807069.1 nucleotidyltransferase [Actinomycetota bacterium]
MFVTHDIVKTFAADRVNLPSADAQKYRKQVKNLRDQLQKKIDGDEDYGLVKMLHSGSVRKGTALRTTSDMDVAVYVKSSVAPTGSDGELIPWMRARLEEAFPQLKPEQFEEQDHCVTLTYVASGLSVDAVPVLYEGEDDNVGYLINKNTGDRVLTSVSRHIEFIKKRKDKHPDDFAQVVRLAKWWVKQLKARDPGFRLKSFMVELLLAHLSDTGQSFADHPAALEALFDYILDSGLQERIAFKDFYAASKLPEANGAVMEIFDPVNPDNNVAARYTDSNRRAIVAAAEEAADAIAEAMYSDTKSRAVARWQTILGTSFKG